MSSPLASAAFRRLFAAQLCSLLAVGLLTVALSLAAWRIGGESGGGQLLGLLLLLKMVAYVGLAPLAQPLLAGRSRKRTMVGLDLGRLLLLLPMGLASDTWQLVLLVFLFFTLTAAFTPLFQSLIPEVLPDEQTYSRALAWSRVAYTLESIMSPVIAVLLLGWADVEQLFPLAALCLLGSVLMLLSTRFPTEVDMTSTQRFFARAVRGITIFRHTPRLRGLFLLNVALSLIMAWVLVNTVVYAGSRLGDAEGQFPLLMACLGLGAAASALWVPSLVRRFGERTVMLSGVFAFAGIAASFALFPGPPVLALYGIWFSFGVASSLTLTPGGLVLTRSASRRDRTAVFAAHFSLSHAGWMLAYPLAGWLVAQVSLERALLLLSACGTLVAYVAARSWPSNDPAERRHEHPELPVDHPHLVEAPVIGTNHSHAHAFHVDELHPRWPS